MRVGVHKSDSQGEEKGGMGHLVHCISLFKWATDRLQQFSVNQFVKLKSLFANFSKPTLALATYFFTSFYSLVRLVWQNTEELISRPWFPLMWMVRFVTFVHKDLFPDTNPCEQK